MRIEVIAIIALLAYLTAGVVTAFVLLDHLPQMERENKDERDEDRQAALLLVTITLWPCVWILVLVTLGVQGIKSLFK